LSGEARGVAADAGTPVTAAAHRAPAQPDLLWLAALPLALFALLAWGLGTFALPWRFDAAWVPSLDVALAFRVDGLSALMLALIFGVGTGVFVYASGYLAHEARPGRLLAVLTLFMLAMAGAVSADNVFLLFAFWELTSLTSFLLVGFKHKHSAVRAAARQALLITLGGGLALLGGLILLGQMAGAYTLSGIVAAGPALAGDPRLPYALALVMLGAFTKSAQFPFHFWLPNAMAAPTPVSAYLHSATMVKLGIYLLARLDPAFNAVLFWEAMLVGVGTLTAVWAAVLALRERDLKRILARSTVSALGTLTLLIGLPNPGAGLAAVVFLFAHALYKAPLFMVAGNIDHATGTRIIDHLMGLRRAMPWTAAVAVLAGLSMAGLPLSFGFVAKDAMSAAKAEAEIFALVSYATVFVNAIAVAVAGVAAVRIFWGPPEAPRGAVHEVSWRMLLPPFAIVLLGMEIDFFPAIADPLLIAAARAVSPELGAVALSAALDLEVLLSATGIAAAAGLLLFFTWDRLHAVLQRLHGLDRYGPAAAYERALHGVATLAAWQTRALQSGRLSAYVRLSVASLLALGGAAWLASADWPAPGWPWQAHGWAWLAAGVLIAGGALAAAGLRDRLALLMASGLVGYGSALLFLFAGAPDLAFTQFVVETILVVVAASVLPHYAARPPARPAWRPLDVALALAAGTGSFVLLAQLAGLPADRTLADWFAANSLPAAHGHNVVNVIIVDFRALDTLGEIAVVAFSLLAALPLLAGLKQRPAP
jgi:multicomponent Na+:H+ antiporter subunit A